jgi:hypothetical protein
MSPFHGRAFKCTYVIPAKAGIQFSSERHASGPELDSRLRGNDGADLED